MAYPNGLQLIHVYIGCSSERRDAMRFKAEFFFSLKYPHICTYNGGTSGTIVLVLAEGDDRIRMRAGFILFYSSQGGSISFGDDHILGGGHK